MTGRRFYVVFVIAIFMAGCVREMKSPEPSPGLDTVPFYSPRDLGFDTRGAIQGLEQRKLAEAKMKEELKETIQKRVEEAAKAGVMFDPWIPPQTKKLSEIPVALRGFPRDRFGYVDWKTAVEQGLIKPFGSISGKEVEDEPFDMDIVFIINDRLMADVKFSHRVHTTILSCKNCHPSIFREKKGGNLFTMYDVWNGQYCGRCHGKVAFQAKGYENCQRCHSVLKRRTP